MDKREQNRIVKEIFEDLKIGGSSDANQVQYRDENTCDSEYNILKKNFESLLEENNKQKISINQYQSEEKRQLKKIKFFKKQVAYYRKRSKTVGNTKKQVHDILSKILTKNQIAIILNKKKKVKWTADEIGTAFTLRYFSKKSYVYLRSKLNYPLPGLSTLRRWAKHIDLRHGVLTDVLKFMELEGQTMQPRDKCVILQYDEIKVKATYEYDTVADEIIGPHNYMQVIMARGLFGKWKQPVYIEFDQKITKDILYDIIEKLHNINFDVVGCVSDCGGGNVGLWKTLGINAEEGTCTFKHPLTNNDIYLFADVPHMLKLLRNWFIDRGFLLQDRTIVNKKPVEALINLTDFEVNTCFKLTSRHIECEKTKRQNVRLAAELLSHTTATALLHYKPGANQKLAIDTGNFINLTNKWFDIMNSYAKLNKIDYKSGYGVCLTKQDEILHEMYETVKHMRVIGKNALYTFQKGILMSIRSLQLLYKDMCERYQVKYILTHRLNQDSLENFFFQIRVRGGLNDHPSPMNALYRIRMIILGKNPGILNTEVNTEDKSPDEYILAKVVNTAEINLHYPDTPNIILENYNSDDQSDDSSSVLSSETCDSTSISKDHLLGETAGDALTYIAGYLAKKHKEKFSHLGDYTYKRKERYNIPSWVQHLSYGGLIEPNTLWMNEVKQMEDIFNMYHKQDVKKLKPLTTVIRKIAKRVTTPKELVKDYVKLRTIIKINYLNLKMSREKIEKQSSLKRKRNEDHQRKVTKKYKKIVN